MAIGYKIGTPVMMQLGSFQFGITTAAYQEMQRSTAYNWAVQERFGQLPTAQFTGPGDDTMTLPGIIYPEWRGGFTQVEQMRALAAEGLPQQLVDGSGGALGRWVIEQVDEGQSIFGDAGAARRQTFTLMLRRFPDAPPAPATGATAAAAATGATIPTGATGALAKVQGLAGNVASAAKSLSGTLNQVAGQVQAAVAPITAVARDAIGGVARALAVADELQTAANRTLSMVGISPLEITALNGAQNLAAQAAGLVVAAESSSAVLRNSSARLATLSNVPASATRAMVAATSAAERTVALARQTAAQAATIKG